MNVFLCNLLSLPLLVVVLLLPYPILQLMPVPLVGAAGRSSVAGSNYSAGAYAAGNETGPPRAGTLSTAAIHYSGSIADGGNADDS